MSHKLTISSIILTRFLLFTVQGVSEEENPYCTVRCGTEKPTLCEYAPCTMSEENCKPPFKAMPLEYKDKLYVVQKHNILRSDVNFGLVKNLNGFANDLNVISYDLELEFSAQCWANMCFNKGAHDTCRRIGLNDKIGQNSMHWKSKYHNLTVYRLLSRVFKRWRKDGEGVDVNEIFPYKASKTQYQRFVQIIWNKVKRVGCGAVYFNGTGQASYVVVCNYNEAPVDGFNPFSVGITTCNFDCRCMVDAYPSLCGPYINVKNQRWKPPFDLNITSNGEEDRKTMFSTTKYNILFDTSTWTWPPMELFSNEQISLGIATYNMGMRCEEFILSLGVVFYRVVFL